MRSHFGGAVRGAGGAFRDPRLELSFRSAPGVLNAIDRVFGRPEAFAGLSSGDGENTVHEAVRSRAPALVEIWPLVEAESDDDDGLAWEAPLDARSDTSAAVRLAQRIAAAVKFWLDGGVAVGDGDKRRTPRPGDVIVLVRWRGPLFEAVLQALKRAEVPVAGADRLKLTDHIAVMDLMALGDALTLEADDYALACVLKSPLFGLSEEDLFAIAHGRDGTLGAALQERARGDDRLRDAAERLARWREEARALRPFDFYSRVLGRDRGRKRMLERLGTEAADAIDEFLAHALVYEQTEAPTLAGFLAFLRRAGTEVKRDLEVESDAVRVMTVHGAKGLEAPIVVLADTTAMPDGRHDSRLFAVPVENAPPGTDAFVWGLNDKSDSQRLSEARETARGRREAEYRRLLYVALTRTADALVVCGYKSKGQGELPAGCWYRLVRDALAGTEEKPELVEFDALYADGNVLRWRPEEAHTGARASGATSKAVGIPPWLVQPAPPAPEPPQRLIPSDIHDASAETGVERSGSGRSRALRRGDLVHRLLQFLPDQEAAARPEAAARFLATVAADRDQEMRASLADEALAVLGHPDMADLFGAQSRAEVEIAARLPGDPVYEVYGRIDRLKIDDSAVWIVDFKTDASPPRQPDAVPIAYVDQLALYRTVIQRIFPGRTVRAMLLFTMGPKRIEVEAARLDAAVARFGRN
jgi:ATP-dependent helicase/nuclease subunit A